MLLDRRELLARERAESELGLAGGRTNVLVALGQGAEVGEATARCLRRLAGRDDVCVAALSSALAALGEVPDGVVELRATYPMSRYFAAFDAAVSAAGYNAFHELIALGVPSLFVPMARETDDQPARARWAAGAGLGLAVEGPVDAGLDAALERLLDQSEREPIKARLAALDPPTGAADAAAWLTDLAAPAPAERTKTSAYATESSARTGWRDFRRRWGTFIASAPRTAVRLGRQQLREPRARALVLAVGIDPDEAPAAVEAALVEAGEPPQRTLVVTDALAALGSIRALGVGVEHVPGAGSRQAQLAGGPYEDFLRRRLELITAERPRARAVVVAPGGAPLP